MADYREAFIGIDVAKLRNAIAIADSGREGEVRFFGEVDASVTSMRRVGRVPGRGVTEVVKPLASAPLGAP